MLRDTVDALELMQTMRRIRTVAIRNTVNTRISDLYKQQLGSLQRKYESEHVSTLDKHHDKFIDFHKRVKQAILKPS